jgi:hypothetical protein
LGPSASKIKAIKMSGSSVGSSSEVNSPTSFAATENTPRKIKEFNGTLEEPEMEGTVDISHDSQKDFATKKQWHLQKHTSIMRHYHQSSRRERSCR